MNWFKDKSSLTNRQERMSQRSRSIADMLKSMPIKRPVRQLDNQEPLDDSEEQPTESRQPTDSQRSPLKEDKSSSTSSAEDLVSRLSRLHGNTPSREQAESSDNRGSERSASDRPKERQSRHQVLEEEDQYPEDTEEETHRATSRHRRRYDDEEPLYQRPRHRSRRNDYEEEHSDVSEGDHSEDEVPSRRPLSIRTSSASSASTSVRSRDRLPARRHEEEPRSPVRGRPLPARRPIESKSIAQPLRGRRPAVEEEYSDEEGSRSSRPSSETFSTLPKATITKIAKSVDVGSLSADAYDKVKDLCGEFVHRVIDTVSKQHDQSITSADLEPVVEKLLGREVEDLEQSYINSTTFMKWMKSVADRYQVTLKKEAVLYLHNVAEFYILCMFYNSIDLARRSRRSRIGGKDLEIAARMR